ncbi:hypothetical protein L1F30_06935 [Simiduia sp. 21SJ11W-1]|uniref:hypothetical protein n=1 Tax=Simiduia sp. 21SJ11W-1 TaxID=2909669 RepID=UPI00209D342B|nr:hypothetical protein [Simiduia sp. 21SJ11W-1]UTA49267.1 hypothetical protein L1F30_06935 [Simiduia sp. 21SJ11W-1]
MHPLFHLQRSRNTAATRHPVVRQFLARPFLAVLLVVIALAAAGRTHGASLAPEFEADRLLLAAEQALADNQYASAEQHLADIAKLGISLPNEYHFFKGQILANESQYTQATDHFTRYVNQAGKNARFYQQSLAAITDLKRRKQPKPLEKSSGDLLQWGGISDGKSDAQYTAQLKQLYKTGSDATALTRHINSLLKFYALPASSNYAGGYFQLKVSGNRIATVIKQDPSNNSGKRAAKISGYQFSAFGVNPYLSAECGKNLDFGEACWFTKPESIDPWIVVKPNKVARAELEKALSVLIKTLQRRG